MVHVAEEAHSFTALADALVSRGFGVWPAFFDPGLVGDLVLEIRHLHAIGATKPAAVGRRDGLRQSPSIRNDSIYWLENPGASPPQILALARIDELRTTLNRELYLGLKEIECHYAIYPSGGHYEKHRDRFRDDDARVVSIVIYLDEQWTAVHGGELRLYSADDPEIPARDILPAPGTLACFLSDKIWHEVLPTKRVRQSLTGWMRR